MNTLMKQMVMGDAWKKYNAAQFKKVNPYTPQGQKDIAKRRELSFKQREALDFARCEGDISIEEVRKIFKNSKQEYMEAMRVMELKGYLKYVKEVWVWLGKRDKLVK